MIGGAGECAADVAEQLALEERLDDRRAVHGDEALRRARPELVKCAGDELLAGAGLAGDERRARVRRQPPDQAEDLLHGRTAADHAAELEPLRELALERQHRAACRRLVAHADASSCRSRCRSNGFVR